MGSLIAVAALGASAQLLIQLPPSISVAPITGQSLVVLLMARLLPWNWSAAAIIFYLLLGGLGLPVFSDFSSGTEVLFGKSAGYFFGFIVAAIVIGKMAEKRGKHFKEFFLEFILGSAIILFFGALLLLRFMEFESVYLKGVRPFLAGALVKVLIGSILLTFYYKVSSFLKKIPEN